MEKILFICSGNVGRSQMAEAFYNHFTKSKSAKSAGVDPKTSSKYGHPTKEIIQVMSEEKIDVSKNKIKTITEEMVEYANEIYVMCKKEECPKFLSSSNKITYWEIIDPYRMDMNGARKIKDNIKEKIKSIIDQT